MRLSDEQVKKYVAYKGGICPVCGATALVSGEPHDHGIYPEVVNQDVRCRQCRHSWTDMFVLVGIWNNNVREPNPEEES